MQKMFHCFNQISTDSLGDLQVLKGYNMIHCSLSGNLFEKKEKYVCS